MAFPVFWIGLYLAICGSMAQALAISLPRDQVETLDANSQRALQAGEFSANLQAERTAGLAYVLGAALTWPSLSGDARLRLRQAAARQVGNTKPVVVVGGDFDEAENVLSAVGLPFVKVAAGQIENHLRQPCQQVVVLNSGARLQRRERAALKRFTRRGGVVLASDLAGKVLARTFPGRKLNFRRISSLDRAGPVRVEPASRPTSAPVRNGSCSLAPVAQPFQKVLLHGLPPHWHLDESSRSLNVSAARGVHVLARSDDLRPPHDGIVSCFNSKRGSVFYVTGRLFQLLLPGEERSNDNPSASRQQRLTRDQLTKLLGQLDTSFTIPLSNQRELLQFPPTLGQVTSSRLSTGFMLQLLNWRWEKACPSS